MTWLNGGIKDTLPTPSAVPTSDRTATTTMDPFAFPSSWWLNDELRDKIGEYPLYSFLLHTDKDQEIVAYLNGKNPWIHNISGKDCLIFTFEKPSNRDKEWKATWEARLGKDFNKIFDNWEKMTDFSRNTDIKNISDIMGIPINHMPCLVFTEDIHAKNLLEIPIIVKKEEDCNDYFMDIFTCVNSAAGAQKENRIIVLRSKWENCWKKRWSKPEYLGEREKAIYDEFLSKGGSIIKKLDNLVNILNDMSPTLKRQGEDELE